MLPSSNPYAPPRSIKVHRGAVAGLRRLGAVLLFAVALGAGLLVGLAAVAFLGGILAGSSPNLVGLLCSLLPLGWLSIAAWRGGRALWNSDRGAPDEIRDPSRLSARGRSAAAAGAWVCRRTD